MFDPSALESCPVSLNSASLGLDFHKNILPETLSPAELKERKKNSNEAEVRLQHSLLSARATTLQSF